MKVILFSILFLIVYTISFTYETICLVRNPRPKLDDKTKIRFRDLEIKKTQTMFRILAK